MLNDFDLLLSVFLAQELNWRLLWLLCVKPCVAAKQILSGEKGWEHEVFLPCLHTSLTPCLQWMTIANVDIFSPSHQMFPCMCRDTIRFGFWRWGEHLQPHLNSNCSSSKWVKNVMTSKVQWIVVWGETPFSTGDRSQFCRIYYITKECWAWQTACLVLPRYNKAWKHSVKILKPSMSQVTFQSKGRCMQFGGVEQIWNVSHGEIQLKMQCKWKWQNGGRENSSSTAAPSALLRVLSL